MFESRGAYLHFCIGFTYLLCFKSSIMLVYYFYLEIQQFFLPYLSKRRPHGNLQFVTLCTYVQVRMRDSKTRQNFLQEKVEKLY